MLSGQWRSDEYNSPSGSFSSTYVSTVCCVVQALAAAELSPSMIQEVVLVGGCSRVPAIR